MKNPLLKIITSPAQPLPGLLPRPAENGGLNAADALAKAYAHLADGNGVEAQRWFLIAADFMRDVEAALITVRAVSSNGHAGYCASLDGGACDCDVRGAA